MQNWLQDSEEQYYGGHNYYERISETMLEIITARAHSAVYKMVMGTSCG